MFGAVMKTYFAEKLGVSPDQIFTLSIMPCVAKKGEREMDLFYGEYAGHDVDAVLTTRELVKMIRSAHIRPDTLVEIPGDSPMHAGTGAGVIFGATGGVMEAALRTAYFTLKGENPPADAFKAVRSGGFQENAGVQEAEFAIGDIKLRTAAVSGLGNTRRLLQQIERGEVHYDFVEVMACPGGCVGGGGQPIHDGEELAFARGRKLWIMDSEVGITPENNGEVIRLGIPPLTEERRRLLAKQSKQEAETAKISIRNARRDAIEQLKKSIKTDGTPEDVEKDAEAEVQKVHDKYIKKVDELYAAKEKEIMTV